MKLTQELKENLDETIKNIIDEGLASTTAEAKFVVRKALDMYKKQEDENRAKREPLNQQISFF